MAKILAIGIGPLLEPGVQKISGQCLRTWHFIKPLLNHGHDVRLFTIPIPLSGTNICALPITEERRYETFSYTNINRHALNDIIPIVEGEIALFKPDALLGINALPSQILSAVNSTLPLWVDLNGYSLVEGQTKCRIYNSDEFLPYFWMQEMIVVSRADRFSVVSKPQEYALLGELAVAGRLNRWTFDYPFVHWVPNAVHEMYSCDQPSDAPELRGTVLPREAFIVLWSGGYNTWTDVDLLYSSLISAMESVPRLYFVSTGGMVEGHDEITYKRFKDLVGRSHFSSRFQLFGWIEAERIPAIYKESDLGINLDSFNYEMIFGARNRLVNMMAMGLPVLTTLGTEISGIIEREDIGFTVPIADANAFTRAIVSASENLAILRQKGTRGKEYVLNAFNYEKTTRDLVKWCERPFCSPDNVRKHQLGLSVLNPIEKDISSLTTGEINSLRRAMEKIDSIKSNFLYKIYKKMKNIFKKR